FAFSIERVIMALKAEGKGTSPEQPIECYLISVGDAAKEKCVELLYELRKAGVVADKDYSDKKIKAQFKTADRLSAKYTAILGEDELDQGFINIKDMETGEQSEVELHTFIEYMRRKVGGRTNDQ